MESCIYRELQSLLMKDSRFVADGFLLKNKIVECALNLDEHLLSLLLSNETVCNCFFQKAGEVLVFDKLKFQRFVSNKKFLPDSYTAFRNKIGLLSGDEYVVENHNTILAWPYKDCVLEGGQTREEQGRKESFWNETLAPDEIDRLFSPKVFTSFKRYTADRIENVKNLSEKDNLIIKGNNLLVMHSLKRKFAKKVKVIYIDPPYNTGNDGFRYNDNFNHSTWLTFMKNRLEVAKEFLRDDGCIYVHCDDNEQAYLKVLMDEIFGVENFIANIVRVCKAGSGHDSKFIAVEYDYVLFYCKDATRFVVNKMLVDVEGDSKYKLIDEHVERRGKFYLRDMDYKGSYSESMDYPISLKKGKILYPGGRFGKPNTWRWSLEKFKWGCKNGFVVIDEEKEKVYIKQYQFVDNEDKIRKRYLPFRALTTNLNSEGAKEIQQLFGGKVFDFPKPESIIEYLLKIASKEGDVVMDYHLGSGTTAAVAHKMNRQYIGIEQMDYIESVTVERLRKVIRGEQGGGSKNVDWKGGGSFVYCEMAEWNQKVVSMIMHAVSCEDLSTIWNQHFEHCIRWNLNVDENPLCTKDSEKMQLNEWKSIMLQMIEKNMLYIPYSEMEDMEYGISDFEKHLNRQI